MSDAIHFNSMNPTPSTPATEEPHPTTPTERGIEGEWGRTTRMNSAQPDTGPSQSPFRWQADGTS